MAVLLLVHLLAVLTLAASPRLHHWLHPDEQDDDGDCAVMLFLHAGIDAAPALVVFTVLIAVILAVTPVPFPEIRVATVFSLARIFEHGPPCWR